MSTRVEVLLWAQRVLARKASAPPHLLLEVEESATAEEIQAAFHKIARTAHPDLHRHGLDAAELELVTSAYAAVAGAYAQMRTVCMQTGRIRTVPKPDDSAPPPRTASPAARAAEPARTVQAAPSDNPAPAPGSGPTDPAQAMSPAALLYYRKAEACMNRGDLRGAMLQLKLACTTDPTSGFLRTTLAEVEAEVRDKAQKL